jgi:hypothetical protein
LKFFLKERCKIKENIKIDWERDGYKNSERWEFYLEDKKLFITSVNDQKGSFDLFLEKVNQVFEKILRNS